MAEKKAGSDAPVVNSSKRMFDLVAEKLGTGISSVVFWFFVFFGLWLEIGNFATAPELDRQEEKPPVKTPAMVAPPIAPRVAPRPVPPSPVEPKPAPAPALSESLLETPVVQRRPMAPRVDYPDLFGEQK
jgi:hypothetical protein